MSDSPPVDLDLRLVRCFTVVAEHRHFGRAAAALHLTQSSLSRQIARLEQQVGARLLDRTPQGSTLTEAGEVFLPLAKASLRSTAQAVSRTRDAAQPSRIIIGFITNMIITPAVRELRHRHPDAEVQTRYLDWNEPRAALLDHRVDAAVTRLPFPTDKLRVTVLYDEPRVVLVPVSHRLAGKESVTLDDLVDEPRIRASDPAGDAFAGVEPGSGGPVAKSIEDKFELVASGQAVAIIPAAAGISSVRPDLTTVPLDGVEPSHVVLATRADDRSRLVAAFRRYAEAQLTGPT